MNDKNITAKVAIINFSGNVGKTTIATHLLFPRMENATVFSIETINSGIVENGLEIEKLKGKKYGDLINALLQTNSAIVDVGSSNVEDFVKNMRQFDGSHEEFDYFIVPVVKEKKAQVDTINTIKSLNSIGVPSKKILIVFNKMETDEDIEDEFMPILLLAEKEKMFNLKNNAVIHQNEVYELLKSVQKSLGELNKDENDYRLKLKETTDEDERAIYLKMITLKMLARTANKNLDNVFDSLFR